MTNEYNPDGKEIRFIDSHYKDLFHIPDGSCVQIHYPDEMVVKPCTFIDEYHTQIGYNVFHICQFAEIMERNGASYMPEPEIMGDEAAWKVGKDRILAVQTCEDGYDYTLLDENYNEIDGGQVDNPELSMIEVRQDILESFGPEMINSYEERMAPRYLVAAYHHFENGFDDKLDYYTLEEAEKAAQGYVDGTMEDDGFKYDGAAVYDQQEHKCIRIYGDYPDEKAHAQVRASAEPEQQEPEHFIDHFYVAEDIQKRGALDIKEYSSFDDALRAYYALPDTQRKALGAMNTRDLPGSLDFVQCVDGRDTIIQDYAKVDG